MGVQSRRWAVLKRTWETQDWLRLRYNMALIGGTRLEWPAWNGETFQIRKRVVGADLHNAGGGLEERGIRVYDRKKADRWEPSRERRTFILRTPTPTSSGHSAILERIIALYKNKEPLCLSYTDAGSVVPGSVWRRFQGARWRASMASWPPPVVQDKSGFVTNLYLVLSRGCDNTLTHPVRPQRDDSLRLPAEDQWVSPLKDPQLTAAWPLPAMQTQGLAASRIPGLQPPINLLWFISSLENTHTQGLKIEPSHAEIEAMGSPKKGDYFIAEKRRFLSLRKGNQSRVGSVHTLTGTVALPSPQTGPQGQ